MSFFFGLLGLVGAIGAEPSVRPVGVSVVFDPLKEEFGGFSTLNQLQTIKMPLLVDLGGKPIIEFNEKESAVKELTDDSGNELEGSFWNFPNISEDGSLMRIDLQGEKAPQAGAKALKANGVICVWSAETSVVLKSELVEVKKGEKLTLSDELVFKISDAGKPQWGDDPQMVELEIKREVPELAEVMFYDEDGKVIETSKGGSSRMGMLGMVTVKQGYNLKREVKSFRIEAKVWTDMEEIKVPFDVTVGVGG